MKSSRVVVTGATGLIGKRLVQMLGDSAVTVLSRDIHAARRRVEAHHYVAWDGASAIDPAVFEGVDVVYHLAGEPVAAGRWTAAKKVRILESRELGTRAVVDAITSSGSKPTFVSASAVGYYGSRGDERLTEKSLPGRGFLPEVCQAWETEAERAARAGCRVAMLRVGIVLAPDGGALAKMLPLFRGALGGRLGSGEQWMPWIHIDDVVSLFRHAAGAALEGPINAVAPNPVTNSEFTARLAHAVGRPAFVPAPSLALRLVLGELADVVLSSQRVMPEEALRSGFAYRFPELASALVDVTSSTHEAAA